MQIRHPEGGKSDGKGTQDRFVIIHADQRMYGSISQYTWALSVRAADGFLFSSVFCSLCFWGEAAVNRLAEDPRKEKESQTPKKRPLYEILYCLRFFGIPETE